MDAKVACGRWSCARTAKGYIDEGTMLNTNGPASKPALSSGGAADANHIGSAGEQKLQILERSEETKFSIL